MHMNPPSQRPPKEYPHTALSLVRDRLRSFYTDACSKEGRGEASPLQVLQAGKRRWTGRPHVSLLSVFRPAGLSPFSHVHEHPDCMSSHTKMRRQRVFPKRTRFAFV